MDVKNLTRCVSQRKNCDEMMYIRRVLLLTCRKLFAEEKLREKVGARDQRRAKFYFS